MDETLITKKDLLAETGISYGTLYRWKRSNLLPESWFLHRATATGQETFLPRDRALSRIREIQQLRKEMSMEEIVRHFAPESRGALTMTRKEVSSLEIVPAPICAQYFTAQPIEIFSFAELFGLYLFSEILLSGNFSRDEAFEAARAGQDAVQQPESTIFLLRKYGVLFCVTAEDARQIHFDSSAALVLTIDVNQKKAAFQDFLRGKGISL